MPDNKPTVDLTSTPEKVSRENSLDAGETVAPVSGAVDKTTDFDVQSVTGSQSTIDLPTIDYAAATQDVQSITSAQDSKHAVRIPGYEILGELGRGGMGVVYKARQIRADRLVALKVMLNIDHARSQEVCRFHAEAQAAAQLQHPNIVQVFDVGEVGNLPYFTQEFVEGGTLAQRLAKETLSTDEATRMLHELATAVAFAHSRGVVHRDLKPANVLITAAGALKIADFGLARRMEDQSHLTKDGTILGTPSYMAPEQAYGSSHEIGPLSDVYTLGVILYELLVGRPPFKGATTWEVIEQVRSAEPTRPSEIEPRVPKDLETICLKCLQKDPSRRYASAQELAADLQRYLNNEPILARPTGRWERLVRLCRRHPSEARLVGLVAGLLVMMTGGAVWTAIRINADRNTIKEKQRIADQRLASRNRTIFEVVNRLPMSLQRLPFTTSVQKQLLNLNQELLNAEAEQETSDDQIGPSRQWGLAAIEMRRGEALHNLIDTQTDEGKKEELLRSASAHYWRVIEIAQAVYDSGQGDRAKAAGNLSVGYRALAKTQRLRRNPEFEELFAKVIQLREEALAADRAEDSLARRQSQLASDLRTYADEVGDYYGDNSHYQFSMSLYRRAIDLFEKARDGIEPHYATTMQTEFCHTHQRAAMVASRLKNEDAAINHYKSAVSGHKQLCESNGFDFVSLLNLIDCEAAYGDFLLSLNKHAEARSLYVDIVRNLHILQSDGKYRQLNNTWAMAYYRLGMAAVYEKNPDRMQKYFTRAADIRGVPLQQREDIEGKSQSDALWDDRIGYALAQAWAGQTDPAIKTARRLVERFKAEKNENARLSIATAAIILGIASTFVDQPQRSEVEAEALAALSLSLDAGYNNLDYLSNDPDCGPLRSISGFEKVIERLRK